MTPRASEASGFAGQDAPRRSPSAPTGGRQGHSSPDIDILSPEAIADPYTYFGRLREEHPVAWDERRKSWVLTRHEYVGQVLKDKRFSSDRIQPFIERKLSDPDTDPLISSAFVVLRDWLVFNDPPDHVRLRKLIHKAFTPRAVKEMAERVDTLCDELIAAVPASGEVDIKHLFAYPLPAIVIAEMLGVPPQDRDRFKAWSEYVALIVSAGLDDPGRYQRAAQGMDELARYCLGLVRRYEAEPEDNLITALVQAREENESLSEAEVVATCTLLLFAGHETTANLISSSILALLQHPSQLEALRDGGVDERLAIEELLRFDGPGKAVVRVMSEDYEFEGKQLRAGQRVFTILAAANRDPRMFDDAETLLLDRDPNPHVAFGHGFHFCLGASLARLEAQIAIPKVMRAFPRMTLTEQPLQWQPVFLTRGLEALHVHIA